MSQGFALRTLVLSTLLLALSNCGFSLRGSDVLSVNFSELQFYSEQPNSELARLLHRSLDGADVNVTLVNLDEADSNITLLGIANESLVSRPVTINPRARAAQIELRLSVDMALLLDSRPLQALSCAYPPSACIGIGLGPMLLSNMCSVTCF